MFYFFFFVVAGVITAIFGVRQYQRWRLISSVSTSLIKDIKPGLVEVNGKVVPMETLESPIGGEHCVLYHTVVEEAFGSGSWHKIIETESRNDFCLEDETGQVLVQPQGATLVEISRLNAEIINELMPKMKQLLTQFGQSSALGERKLRYKEQFLKPGGESYVLGEASTVQSGSNSNTKHNGVISLDPKKIFIISDKSKNKLLILTALKAIGLLILGILMLGYGILLIIRDLPSFMEPY